MMADKVTTVELCLSDALAEVDERPSDEMLDDMCASAFLIPKSLFQNVH
jgi:hypothetical protein